MGDTGAAGAMGAAGAIAATGAAELWVLWEVLPKYVSFHGILVADELILS